MSQETVINPRPEQGENWSHANETTSENGASSSSPSSRAPQERETVSKDGSKTHSSAEPSGNPPSSSVSEERALWTNMSQEQQTSLQLLQGSVRNDLASFRRNHALPTQHHEEEKSEEKESHEQQPPPPTSGRGEQRRQSQSSTSSSSSGIGAKRRRPSMTQEAPGYNINHDSNSKPPVGSEEWHRIRRENHKQVERRRRETINQGISELQRLIPNCDKNKGLVLRRAAEYIQQLKEHEAQMMEKWTLEKLLTDQAINELNRQVETLKSELDRTLQENERLKRRLAEQEEEVDELDGEDENDDGMGNNDGNKRSRLSTESSVKAESAT